MRHTFKHLRRLAGVSVFIMAATCAAYACKVEASPGPCGFQEDLLWAMQGGVGSPPHPNWENGLDWTFNKWTNGSSQNAPPLAHAVALWRPVAGKTLANKLAWWNTFFDCQNGGAPCVVPGQPDVGMLKYMKGSELLSHDYDAAVTTAVASVNFWAKKNNNQALADKARKYLRVTFVMYALAAGQGPAQIMIDDNPTPFPARDRCNLNERGMYYFSGPFVAAAGMRARVDYVCTDDRATLLSRAAQLPYLSGREADSQAALVNYLQAEWRKLVNTNLYENVYALDPSNRSLVIDHINTGNQVAALKSVLAGVRTSVVYHFLGWETGEGQVRATLMERNINSSTAPVYAELYTYGRREVHILVPDSDFRNAVPHGTAALLPDAVAPYMAQATSDGKTVSMDIPTTFGKKYHLVLSPDQEPYLIP